MTGLGALCGRAGIGPAADWQLPEAEVGIAAIGNYRCKRQLTTRAPDSEVGVWMSAQAEMQLSQRLSSPWKGTNPSAWMPTLRDRAYGGAIKRSDHLGVAIPASVVALG